MSLFNLFKKKQKSQSFDSANSNDLSSKIVIHGILISHAPGNGKTIVLRALSGETFSFNIPTTIGVDYQKINIMRHNQEIVFQLWDTNSQPQYQIIVDKYINSLRGKKNTFVILVIHQFDVNFQQFKDYFIKHWQALDSSLFIVCQTRVKWKVKGDTSVNRFIKSIFGQELKFFKVCPQTGQGVQEMKNFIVDYFLDQIKQDVSMQYYPKYSKTFQQNLKKLNSQYFYQFLQSIHRKDAFIIQQKLQMYKKISQIYRKQLIKKGVNIKQLLQQNSIQTEFQKEQQSKQIEFEGLPKIQGQINIIKMKESNQNQKIAQIILQAQKTVLKEQKEKQQIKRQDKAKSISFSQIQFQFYERIKDKDINMDELRNQLSDIFSDTDADNKSQRGDI